MGYFPFATASFQALQLTAIRGMAVGACELSSANAANVFSAC